MTANRLREFCSEPGLLSAIDWTFKKHRELLVLLRSTLITRTHIPQLLIREVGLVFYLLLKEAIRGGHYLFSYPTSGGPLSCGLEFEEAKSYSAVPSYTERHFVPSAMAVMRYVPSSLSQKENQPIGDISY